MGYQWQANKGVVTVFECSQCRGSFSLDEFDVGEDCCLYCLFPEAGKARPVMVDGNGVVVTSERLLLDNLDFVPEKQGLVARNKQALYRLNKKYNK